MTLTQNAGFNCNNTLSMLTHMDRKYRDKEWLCSRYVDDKMSLREIGRDCGVSHDAIRRWLEKFGIDRRHSYDVSVDDDRYKDKEWLYDQYWNEPKTASEIADECGVSKATISYWLDKFEIETRKGRAMTKELYYKLNDGDWLREKYVNELKSAYEISELVGSSASLVYDKLDEFGIERRGIEQNRIPHAKDLVSNEKWLREKHVTERKSGPEIADMLDISGATVYWHLDEYGIDHPDAKKPFGYYGPNWFERRIEVIVKYNGKCQGCGRAENELDDSLAVHHIKPLREFADGSGDVDYTGANEVNNLVPLCNPCHNRWEGVGLKPEIIVGNVGGGE